MNSALFQRKYSQKNIIFCFLISAAPSIARTWDERALAAIRADTPHPPGQARNLFSFSVCMYDAWAAYDTNSVGFIYHGKHTAADIEAAVHVAARDQRYKRLLRKLKLRRGKKS